MPPQLFRGIVLQAEPYCVGFPRGRHGTERVRTAEVLYIVRLSQGGAATRDNCQALCARCAQSKKGYDSKDNWRLR